MLLAPRIACLTHPLCHVLLQVIACYVCVTWSVLAVYVILLGTACAAGSHKLSPSIGGMHLAPDAVSHSAACEACHVLVTQAGLSDCLQPCTCKCWNAAITCQVVLYHSNMSLLGQFLSTLLGGALALLYVAGRARGAGLKWHPVLAPGTVRHSDRAGLSTSLLCAELACYC